MGEATTRRDDPEFDGPVFHPGTGTPFVITGTALVIDHAGVGWWIVAEDGERSITKAFG